MHLEFPGLLQLSDIRHHRHL